MPRSRKKSKDSLSDDKSRRAGPNAPRMEEVEIGAEAPAVTESERIAGLVKEYSGWDVYNNEARKVDTELVKDWTGSLNFLLLFAAIFASVLTAFIIESKKLLEPDQIAIMVDVMVFYTNNVANGTHRLYTPPQFQPSSTDITINCLFFASLSTSLVTALASVVALQWVADYDAAITRGGSSPEDRAKRRQFRYAGVVQWRMAEIIAALPVLIYCSVIIFLTGLILWMTVTNHIVGAVVAGGAAVAVLFHGASTLISVIFVSAPFRTPLSQWIYTMCYLPSSAMYALAKRGNTLGVPAWLERQHLRFTNSHKRIDIAVETRGELGKDALIWLANHLSISQDSCRRLVLLVGELSGLRPEHMPSFDVKEASWYDIFDLLGWRFLASAQVGTISGEEQRRMEILQRCHAIPAVQAITNPPDLYPDASDHHGAEYWDQFCDVNGAGPWSNNAKLPNHLYRLLRDLPTPFDFSGAEMQAIVLLGRWRNTINKPPEVWDEVFALEASFHPTFLSSCVATFAKFVRSQDWRGWDKAGKQKYFSTASELVQIATRRGDLPPPTILLLIQAYEAVLIGFGNSFIEGASCLSRPLRYGRSLQQIPAHDQGVHDSIILLLSRQIQSYPMEERTLRVREVIALLWLRPSNPVPRRWENMEMRHGRLDQWDPVIVTDWVRAADSVPHILEILRHLAKAQAEDPSIGALWRTTGTDRSSDPHFVELLQMLDRLMDRTCTASDHWTMVNLVCQDLELEQSPNFEHYFSRDRVNALDQLHDPCLQLLAGCARGSSFVNLGILTEEYHAQRTHSLNRIEEYLLKLYPDGELPAILELKASLWPAFSGQSNLCQAALESRPILTHLQCIFRYPIPCMDCLDGIGHLPFHIVQGIFPRRFYVNIFSENQRIKPSMDIDLIILWRLFKDRDLRLEDILLQADDWCLQELTTMFNEIKGALSSSLSHIWSIAGYYERRTMWPDDLAVISKCTKEALQLPDDEESTSVMSPLASRLLSLREVLLNRGNGMLEDRELVADQAANASQLLLSRLATRLIFGQRNAVAVPCARARGTARPSVRHWTLYDE